MRTNVSSTPAMSYAARVGQVAGIVRLLDDGRMSDAEALDEIRHLLYTVEQSERTAGSSQ